MGVAENNTSNAQHEAPSLMVACAARGESSRRTLAQHEAIFFGELDFDDLEETLVNHDHERGAELDALPPEAWVP